jgi:REP element-mobilizing transposase RayT
MLDVGRSALRVAPKARFHRQPGANAPGFEQSERISAESAIHSAPVQYIIADMPQSLSKVFVHIIFSTKDREPWLDSDVRTRMHAYLATICRDLGADFVRVGGVSDHVHIVTTLSRTLSQAQLIEQIKKTFSKWIKTVDARYRGFTWQRGYGAFSVNPSQLESVRRYIDGQQEHHRTRTFQEEYRDLLRKHGVDFDECYVWD